MGKPRLLARKMKPKKKPRPRKGGEVTGPGRTVARIEAHLRLALEDIGDVRRQAESGNWYRSRSEMMARFLKRFIRCGDDCDAKECTCGARSIIQIANEVLQELTLQESPDKDEAAKLAKSIGYPVLIKAAAGGGGKGMRVCWEESGLRSAWQQARAEANAAFGNPSLYLEKFIDRPRHVEVQVLADTHGNAIHCWERECSLQRRHQKLVEESPSPSISSKTRRRMGEAAVRLVKAANYVNAGTCEFLVDAEENFYFIEVNARIQVEHPVTEMVTGLDLIKEQIRIAAGEPISVSQAEVPQLGHAIECRINCEDPEHNFRPGPGTITGLRLPGGIGIRWDSHVRPGYRVPPNYDSLVGKLLVHARSRPEAIARMRRALEELNIEGVPTTIPLHRRIMNNPDFIEGRVDTTWIERVLLAPREGGSA